jgi:hypothetical protein
MKAFLIILISLIAISCTPTKRINFQTETLMSKGKVHKFTIEIPKGYEESRSDISRYLLNEYVYPDSSVLYISLDINYQNSPNKKNWIKCSDATKGIKCEEGLQENNMYWKEILSNNLVLGYYNVSSRRKLEFDQSLQSIEKK